jgi:hypothetical protein
MDLIKPLSRSKFVWEGAASAVLVLVWLGAAHTSKTTTNFFNSNANCELSANERAIRYVYQLEIGNNKPFLFLRFKSSRAQN